MKKYLGLVVDFLILVFLRFISALLCVTNMFYTCAVLVVLAAQLLCLFSILVTSTLYWNVIETTRTKLLWKLTNFPSLLLQTLDFYWLELFLDFLCYGTILFSALYRAGTLQFN